MPLALVEDPTPRPRAELERVYESHAGMVFRTAYRLTGNASDAEDVLQTVFLRLLRRDPSAGPVDNPESYLRRAAIHASLDLIRERQKRAEAPLEPAAARAPDDVGLRDLLRQALAALDPRQAEMFTLRFLEGYSNGEIARMLGMSQVLVAVTVHRTRRRLQKEMQGHIRGGRS